MTPDVYSKIMNVANDSSLQLYSSAKIQKLGEKSPLEVKIETPENITKVTQDMYRNAAVTLGVEHARITVAAPIPAVSYTHLDVYKRQCPCDRKPRSCPYLDSNCSCHA